MSLFRRIPLVAALLAASSLSADVIGSWTFNSGATTAERLQSSGSPAGATVSSLIINPSVSDFGPGAVPSGDNDGMGFGGNGGEQTMFWHRANFFNPNTPATTWGNPGVSTGIDTTVATAPMSFTVTADGTQSITVESITVDGNTEGSIVYVQEAGKTVGSSVTGVDITVPLNEPVVVAAGTTKTFTINWNSGALDSKPVINQIDVNGTLSDFHHDGVLAEWTFNSELGSTSADLLEVATLVPGVTVSDLAINADIDDFGKGAVPSGDNDGFGFGGNSGEYTMFWHRANYTNDNAPVGEATSWGDPVVDTGIDTTLANAPMSFTVTAGTGQSVAIDSLLIHCVGTYDPFTVYIQEAGQTLGLGSTEGEYVVVALNAPVTISAGSSKTFTINWNSDAVDSRHIINEIDLRGSVSPTGTQRTIRTQYSDAVGQATPPTGWAFYWNAPDGWSPGVTGDVATGEVTDDSSWTSMVWGANMWTADGNNNGGDSSPDNYLRIMTGSGHVGGSGATRELDRYCISAFTVDVAGDYQIGQAWIQKVSSNGNGFLVKIFLNGQLFKTIECAAGDVEHFDARFDDLLVGDEIAVAVGSNGDSGYDTYYMDYQIVLVDPTFDGLATFDVADYGAVGDGSTDDFDAIHAAVNAAKSAGGGIVRFDGSKSYRTIGDSTDEDTIENVFELEGTSNIKVEGNGASLLIHPPDRFANIENVSNVQVDGFTITYGPLPYYQGTIDAIDVANLTMDITVPNRYDEPETGTNMAPASTPFFARSFVPDSAGARWGSGHHLYIDSTATIGGDPRKIRLSFSSDQTSNLQNTLNDGATEMVVPHIRYGHHGNFSLKIDSSDRVKISNVLYRNNPFFLCAPGSNMGPVTLSNLDVLTADPANELFVSWRDCFHVKDNRFGVLIEDGDWHGGAMNDDLFNFSCMMKQVTATSGNTLSLKAGSGFGGQHPWYAGEWVSVWDPTQTILKGRARIVAPSSTLTWNSTLTLDGSITANVDDWVVNESALNRGMLVRNCINIPLGTRPGTARLRTPTHFQNNYFDGAYIWIHTTDEHEGPKPRDLVFENMYLKGSYTDHWKTRPLDIVGSEDITFKDCIFDDAEVGLTEDSEVYFDTVEWVNNSGRALLLEDNSEAYVFNQSTRNGSDVVLADADLLTGSQLYLTAPAGYNPLLLAPVINTLSLADGATEVALDTSMTLTFSENIALGSGDITLMNLTDGTNVVIAVTDASQVSVSGANLIIDPTIDLDVAKDYAVLIDDGAVQDLFGNAYLGIDDVNTWNFTTVLIDPNSAGIRVTEYFLTTGNFTGTTATLTLNQDLADDYYILVRGSRDGNGTSDPNNDYARISAVPGGQGDLPDSGASDQLTLQRQNATNNWEGVVTVVECQNSANSSGFSLIDATVTTMTGTSGTVSTTAWSDINQVVLFGGYRGGGVEMFGTPTNRKQGTGCYTRLYPSGSNTLNWTRDAGGETMFDATMTTFVVEWGSDWTVQHVNVVGSNGGNGADATSEYTTAAINSVNRDNTWVWATGTRVDSGIGDCAEACLVTLGDGVTQNVSESTVAVGSEYSDAYDFDVYVMTHSGLSVDHRFKVDGDSTSVDLAQAVDTASAGTRFGWVTNGCNGTGAAFARPRMWARYTDDGEITISRGYSGQNFPAWIQGIDFSGVNE